MLSAIGKKRGSPQGSVPLGEPLYYSERNSVVKIWALFWGGGWFSRDTNLRGNAGYKKGIAEQLSPENGHKKGKGTPIA